MVLIENRNVTYTGGSSVPVVGCSCVPDCKL